MRDDVQRVSLPRSAWVALTAGGLLVLSLLGVQLALIEDQRSSTDRLLRTAVRQADAARPLLEDAKPMVRDLRDATPQIKRLGRDASALTRGLRRADAPAALEAVRRLSEEVLRADLPATLTDVAQVTDELTAQDRLRRLLVRSTAVLGELRELDTVAKGTRAAELAPRIAGDLRRSLRVQRRLLATQVEALRVARQTRDIARETERHAASLDRKLGGETPPTVLRGRGR